MNISDRSVRTPRTQRTLTQRLRAIGPILLVGLLAGLASTSPAGARTLKIATLMPEGSSFVSQMREAGRTIERRTSGRVKLKFYPGGVMGGDKTVMRKMRVGQIQGAVLTSGPLASVYPDIEIYSLPLFFRDREEVDYVREHMDPELAAGLARVGFETLSISDGGFAYLFSRTPIRRVEDLPKAKIWIPEDDIMSQTALEIAGVSPIPLPTADVYTALQTGLIDTVAAPPMGAIAFQWHTRVRYMTNVPLMYLIGIVAVDSKTFARLRPEDRAVMREEIASASKRLDAESRRGEANAIEALENQGIEILSAPSNEELERWHGISREAIRHLHRSGRYSKERIDEMVGLVEKYRAMKRRAASGAAGPGAEAK